MARYEHQGGAKATTLPTGISSSSTSFSIADATGWPTGTTNPFWVVIDRGKAAEEKILCSSRSGTTITVSSRGQDGTAAADHDPGATVEHVLTALEIDKFDAVVEDPAANWTQGNAAYEPLGVTFRGAKATRTTAQSIPASTWTVITLPSEDFDSDAFHDTATNPARLTVPTGKAGKYRVLAVVEFAASTTGQRYLAIAKNGTREALYARVDAMSADGPSVLTTDTLNLAEGDYVEAHVFQSSGGALDANRAHVTLNHLGA